MSMRDLQRAVWLTIPQREMLRLALRRVASTDIDPAIPDAVRKSLDDAEGSGETATVVRDTVRWLGLPEGILPVQITDEQADALISRGVVDQTLALLIRPEPDVDVAMLMRWWRWS